jgi:hypothetical protein
MEGKWTTTFQVFQKQTKFEKQNINSLESKIEALKVQKEAGKISRHQAQALPK